MGIVDAAWRLDCHTDDRGEQSGEAEHSKLQQLKSMSSARAGYRGRWVGVIVPVQPERDTIWKCDTCTIPKSVVGLPY